jgi:hypothetical protein
MKRAGSRVSTDKDGRVWISDRLAIRTEDVRSLVVDRMLFVNNTYIDLSVDERRAFRLAVQTKAEKGVEV